MGRLREFVLPLDAKTSEVGTRLQKVLWLKEEINLGIFLSKNFKKDYDSISRILVWPPMQTL